MRACTCKPPYMQWHQAFDGSLDILDLATFHEHLNFVEECSYRAQKAAEKKAEKNG